MREAQKPERPWFPVAALASVGCCEAAELDQAGLVGMQPEPELREPVAQVGQELLGRPSSAAASAASGSRSRLAPQSVGASLTSPAASTGPAKRDGDRRHRHRRLGDEGAK